MEEGVNFQDLLENIDFSDEDFNEPDFSIDWPSQAVLDDKDINNFIESNKNVNTTKKTKSDLNGFKRWCESVNENREPKDIPVQELDRLLSHFFVKVRKQDDTQYEPDTLTSYQRSIVRYLRENEKLYSILTDKEFEKSRASLEAKRKELRKDGKGRRPNKALGLTEEEVEKLWSEGLLGVHSPMALIRTV
ncbi:hypothetical protein QZH41_007979 [Actinostola sp. cb2023]|nr:hypothetical protein QZH41_007979 [Actinostola sp. cb2023]